jgi:hypothetical protein
VHTFGEVQDKKNTNDACRQQVNDDAWNRLKKLSKSKSLQQTSYNNKHKDKQTYNIKKQVEKKIN